MNKEQLARISASFATAAQELQKFGAVAGRKKPTAPYIKNWRVCTGTDGVFKWHMERRVGPTIYHRSVIVETDKANRAMSAFALRSARAALRAQCAAQRKAMRGY